MIDFISLVAQVALSGIGALLILGGFMWVIKVFKLDWDRNDKR
tara:strand:+ start:4012 stop:4140 length:129 start_codon:yes stop_codon:yes gene_type:complete